MAWHSLLATARIPADLLQCVRAGVGRRQSAANRFDVGRGHPDLVYFRQYGPWRGIGKCIAPKDAHYLKSKELQAVGAALAVFSV
jgi:hypothetical protein